MWLKRPVKLIQRKKIARSFLHALASLTEKINKQLIRAIMVVMPLLI